mmetsp:Transcript_3636/g.13329  ORF Transcript_3636/g.13329 Transcript_3636/m.13329 type:complete len:206 (-) Transcript_3636:1059-1676(-)
MRHVQEAHQQRLRQSTVHELLTQRAATLGEVHQQAPLQDAAGLGAEGLRELRVARAGAPHDLRGLAPEGAAGRARGRAAGRGQGGGDGGMEARHQRLVPAAELRHVALLPLRQRRPGTRRDAGVGLDAEPLLGAVEIGPQLPPRELPEQLVAVKAPQQPAEQAVGIGTHAEVRALQQRERSLHQHTVPHGIVQQRGHDGALARQQ